VRLAEIEKKARSLGIKDTWKFSKSNMIKEIQRAEGNYACFGTAKSLCEQMSCCWRIECLK
jgi:hypothetical protein